MAEKTKILGVTRKSRFSPNHIGNDAAIFNEVCEKLTLNGADIEICNEDEFLAKESVSQDFILTMGRTKTLVKKLQKLESDGKIVVNSGIGIENCFRTNMTNALLDGGIPYPKSYVVSTTSDILEIFKTLKGKGVWIKRGDFHAIHKEDVTFASSSEEAQYILNEYAMRGIKEAVISEHLVGDLLKFYAVRDTGFFYSFYPYEHNHHKYAVYEQINGETVHYSFDEDKLKKMADRAAEILGVQIYGGDVIISPDGDFHIIDLNDWPSFAPCRSEASEAISNLLINVFTIQQNAKRDISIQHS
jgi:phosphoribosylaminoimidazole carboxylase (NCAIR synthetase)